tara:strand:+ start:1021 stop:1341 length:321 start_codon:yes stop_codon:yes gene_type:complete
MNRFCTVFIILIALNSLPIQADSNLASQSQEIINKAKSKNKVAIKLKNEWRDTRKIIKAAQKAHSKKNYKKSIELAKEALNQATMAVKQHNFQKDRYRFLDGYVEN